MATLGGSAGSRSPRAALWARRTKVDLSINQAVTATLPPPGSGP